MNRHSYIYHRKERGFTLVEILVALVLSAFLGVGIIQLFISNKQTYKFQDATSSIQDSGRFALELLSNSIRMAAFTGCPVTNPPSSLNIAIPFTNVLNNASTWWADLGNNPLRGYDGDAAFPGADFVADGGNRLAGTDAIIALGGGESAYLVTGEPSNDTVILNTLAKSNGQSLAAGDILIACHRSKGVALFQVSDIPTSLTIAYDANVGTPGNSSVVDTLPEDPLTLLIDTDAIITNYTPTAFYIGVSSSGTTRSLYQMQLIGSTMTAQELVEGVANMQIFYGVDTDNDNSANTYLDAEDVNAMDAIIEVPTDLDTWATVVSVRIHLLLVSLENNVLNAPQTYRFPNDKDDNDVSGTTVTAPAGDLHLYQTWSTTIGIRNRL